MLAPQGLKATTTKYDKNLATVNYCFDKKKNGNMGI